MNISASECSSGSESGWTMYLDQSSLSANQCQRTGGIVDEYYGSKGAKADDEEDEDLSMVSDASSGPPHFHEDEDCFDENGCSCSVSSAYALAKKSEKKKKKIKEHRGKQQQKHSFLDDTASSPVLSFSEKNETLSNDQASMEDVLGFSQGFSATHFKGKSAFQKHFGFLQSSLPEKPASAKPGGLHGRK